MKLTWRQEEAFETHRCVDVVGGFSQRLSVEESATSSKRVSSEDQCPREIERQLTMVDSGRCQRRVQRD